MKNRFLILGLVLTLALTANAQTKADVKPEFSMAHQHSPRFLQIVNESRKRVRETTVDEVKAKLDRGEKFILVDVREESEFAKDHLPGAIHLGKGVIERDIEEKVPNINAPLVLYCGWGYRSALAADNLQKNGLQQRALDGWRHSFLAEKRISSHEITHGRAVTWVRMFTTGCAEIIPSAIPLSLGLILERDRQ